MLSSDGKARILVVDDEPIMRELLRMMLEKEGYAVRTACDGVEAVALFRAEPADVVIEDLKMPRMDGIALLRHLAECAPDVSVIIITAFSTWDSSVEAMRLGAFDYIRKPFDNDLVRATVRRIRKFGLTDTGLGHIIGNAPEMQAVHDIIRRIARTDATVLIQGESGTGKELVARALHYGSHRAHGPFIVGNCAAFTETLLETELFGHVRGAFTGAFADKKGLLEVSDGGTFFMDEIAELTPQSQVELLRVLEDREFRPVGSNETRIVDVRFVAATNRNLAEQVALGAFREDLFYRINVIPLMLPPLRERKGDIPLLAGHFIARYARMMRKRVSGLEKGAMELLMGYDWPGNVRELENTLQRALAMTEQDLLQPHDLPALLPGRHGGLAQTSLAALRPAHIPPEGIDLDERLREIESDYIRAALEKCKWNMTRAARLLGMSFRSLRYRVRKLGVKIN